MKFEDIIALAKQGYKPSDIKELMALNVDEKEEPKAEENRTEESATQETAESIVEQKKESVTASAEPTLDYKALYEASQAELKKAQAINRHTDAGTSDSKPDVNKILDSMIF